MRKNLRTTLAQRLGLMAISDHKMALASNHSGVFGISVQSGTVRTSIHLYI